MIKILEEGDIAIKDGKEFTTEEIKNYLIERVIYKNQVDYMKERIGGGSQ